MYIKLVGASDRDMTHLIPVGQLSYEIELVESFDEFQNLLEQWPEFYMPYQGPDKAWKLDEFGMKVAIIQVYENSFDWWAGAHRTIILCSGYAFVMNENGKTIDKIL